MGAHSYMDQFLKSCGSLYRRGHESASPDRRERHRGHRNESRSPDGRERYRGERREGAVRRRDGDDRAGRDRDERRRGSLERGDRRARRRSGSHDRRGRD